MTKRHGQQKTRKLLIISSMLLFPVTMIYFSPGMVFRGARLGILSGSYVTFSLLFMSAIFFGRLWCAYLCPAGGASEVIKTIDPKPYTSQKLKIIKYIIWGIWLLAIALVVVFIGHGFSSIDLFLGTNQGISIYNVELLAVYYAVMSVIVVSALIWGRRGFCHTLCWMAPFMVLGRKLSNQLNLKALRLSYHPILPCSNCKQCEKHCPMSLPITKMIQTQQMEHLDCILCGECIEACKNRKLSIKFKKLKYQN